jgi:hypothetical protein
MKRQRNEPPLKGLRVEGLNWSRFNRRWMRMNADLNRRKLR